MITLELPVNVILYSILVNVCVVTLLMYSVVIS